MQFHATERLGAVQSLTNEGFLICEGVPVSRTGILIYAPGELPITPGTDGLIRVHRAETDVFAPESLASFEGKSVVDLHPGVDVTPENWRRFAVGHMQNVRRGVGDKAQCVVADLVIKDRRAIDAVRAGKRHVSLGYDAHYRVFAPGNAQQSNIIGNHVALVPEGRCGATCSIGDQHMSTANNRTWMDRIRTAFSAQDETMLAAALAEAGGGGGSAPAVPGLPAIHLHTGDRIGAPQPATAGLPEADRAVMKQTADAVAEIGKQVKDMGDRMTALEKKHEEAATTTAAAAAENEEKAKRDKEEKEKASKTGDSAGLATVFQDVVARAEILLPGVQLPTFDAKATPAATEEVMCGFRRKVLQAALLSGPSREHVAAILPTGADLGAYTCDAVSMVFAGATELAKRANNRGAGAGGGNGAGGGGGGGDRKGPITPAEINERNRKFYNRATA